MGQGGGWKDGKGGSPNPTSDRRSVLGEWGWDDDDDDADEDDDDDDDDDDEDDDGDVGEDEDEDEDDDVHKAARCALPVAS